jgi:hypothetical protein
LPIVSSSSSLCSGPNFPEETTTKEDPCRSDIAKLKNMWLLAKRRPVSSLMMSSVGEMHKTRAEEDLHHWTAPS